MLSSANFLTGSDALQHTPSLEQHRRRRGHSPPPALRQSLQKKSLGATSHSRTSTQGGDWPTKGRDDWLQDTLDERDKPKRKRWSRFREPLFPGLMKSRTYLIYLVFSLVIGINIFIIARSLGADSTRIEDLLYNGSGKGYGDVDGKSLFSENEHYAPRESPLFCDLCPSGDEFCKSIGYHNLASSVVYEGSNVRLHRVLRKLQNGEPISMGVIGGSVSSGHGLIVRGPTDERNGPLNLHRRIFDYLTAKYPHPDHKFTNGAVSATGSDYFATCFAEHIPDNVDLVMIELAINDFRHLDSQVEYEMLVRGVLDLPNKPAIINVHTMGLLFSAISQGGDQHLGVSQFYDLPTISLRSIIFPLIQQDYLAAERFFTMNARKDEFQTFDDLVDYRHINIEGHELLANLTNLYIERQLCKMQALSTLAARGDDPTAHTQEWPSKSSYDTLPTMMVTRMYDKTNNVAPLRPQCFSTMSDKHPLKPVEQVGWEPWAWQDKKYLVAREPGAKASFSFTTEIGILKLFYQHSGKYGLGQADCWVDDDVDRKVRLESNWTLDISTVGYTFIRTDLTPGDHMLHCEVAHETNDPGGGHEFRMTSLTAL